MKSTLVLPLCALVAGCGPAGDPSAASQAATGSSGSARLRPAKAGLKPTLIPSYGIDAGVGTNLYPSNFAITTDIHGSSWAVYWTGDELAHDFYAEISAEGVGSTVALGTFAGGFGDWATDSGGNFIQLSSTTDGSTVPYLYFYSAPAAVPIRFNMYVDGYAAEYQLIYTSLGVESTTDVIPVDLVPLGAMARGGTGVSPPATAAVRSAPALQSSGSASAVRFVEPPSRNGSAADR